jgi:hypothetical protein
MPRRAAVNTVDASQEVLHRRRLAAFRAHDGFGETAIPRLMEAHRGFLLVIAPM